MSASPDEVLKTALTFTEAERLFLATELLNSVEGIPPGLSVDDPNIVAELDRRFNDGSRTVPWEEVRKRLDCESQP